MSVSVQEISVSQSELEALVAQVLEEAAAAGATAAEAGLTVDAGLAATARLRDVETLEYHRDRSLGVSVYFGQRKGSASTADLSATAVRDTVAKACNIARFTAEDDCAGLADPQLMARAVPDLDLYHPWGLGPEKAIELALECEEAALSLDDRISNSEGASLSSHEGMRVYGNSAGFIGGYRSTSHTLSCAVLAGEAETMQRDYWYATARAAGDLQSPEEIGRRAAERTLQRLGARKISTRKAPVVYPPELARGLIGHLLGAVSGASQYRESSFLLKAAGRQVFPKFVNLSERPHLPRALGSAAFDNEGVATRDRELVRDGVLQGYLLDSYAARKLGLQSTGNAGGVHNLLVATGTQDLQGLLATMGKGLLVTELMGRGVNQVTGDYSRGAAGFWIEDGQIAFPVQEITVAGNLLDIYSNLVATGNDVDVRGTVRSGSILVEQMTIAGN